MDEKEALYIRGDEYYAILDVMEKQLQTRAGTGLSNLKLNHKELVESKGDNLTQNVLYGVIESLLFELNNK